MPEARTATSVVEVVENGLCIGCGLCEAVSGGSVKMELAPVGSMRPVPADGFTPEQERAILASCPGVVGRPRVDETATPDLHWGAFTSMHYGWAGDRDVRFRAATGGVLTALAGHLLDQGIVDSVLQVRMVEGDGTRTEWTISRTSDDVIASAGSRYGPTAPLAGLVAALDEGRPFAIVAKPCDLGAVHAYARVDPRVDELCTHRLAMVCGGQSRIAKTANWLAEHGATPVDIDMLRYRGFGNPGLTRAETHDGRAFESTYTAQWEDEGSWDLDARCTVCVDALGEAADIAALDVWPGGGPTGEDAGFNGIIVRSQVGEQLLASAVETGDLVLGVTPDLDVLNAEVLADVQPHQLRKKLALAARFEARAQLGVPVIDADGLRLDEIAASVPDEERRRQIEGTRRRVADGRYSETAVLRDSAGD